ncbi:MAG: hypothetical protein DI533_01220 [Cereibacter sphaeroides]|uniref:DUF1636 domain-containing protein n=1 Tax=Cereibacter sphaeroides TaxID=1063 RepID=A0A2W5SF80_CERSP|nr:MAG: hypothetical protein DI533_01220 [Cereibacter sphaeroides]
MTAACMQGCTRSVALSVRAPGKMAYLFGETGIADVVDIVTFIEMYSASPDGDLADARPLGQLRFKAIARIPA